MAQKLRLNIRGKWLGQPATAQGVVPVAAGASVPAEGGLYINRVELQNRGSGVAAAAVVAFIKDALWKAGQWTDATTTFTNDTADSQDADTNDFALETTTVNDGFLVASRVQFGAISLDVTTAGSGTSPTHVIEYWNGAWTALAAAELLVDVARSADWAAGEALILFDPPADWVEGGSGTNVPQGMFCVRVRRTNATQATAALARRVYIGQVLESANDLAATTGTREWAFPAPLYVPPSQFAAVGGAFETAANANLLDGEVTAGVPF